MAQGAASGAPPQLPRAVLLYSHSWLPGQVDGVAVRMMAHARSLSEKGVKVVVATPDFERQGKPAPLAPDKIPGVEHVLLQSQPTPVYHKNLCMRMSLKNFWTLVCLIKRVKPDLVHGTQEASMQVLASACIFCDVPLVISLHTDVAQIAERDKGFSKFIGGAVGRAYTQVALFCVYWGYRNWGTSGGKFFCVSPQSRAILGDAGVRDSSVCSGTWGPMVERQTFRIDLPEQQVSELRRELCFGIEDAFLMLYIGRVTAEKDIRFLVDALERAPKRVVLALIGPVEEALQDLRGLHGKERRLHCSGEMHSREKVALMLRGADCCVSASTMETVGFTAMEALSCGTPCLMANAQGFALHLTHGVNARLFTPHSEESFDGELRALIAQPREGSWSPEALRESMADASVDHCTNRALKVYEAVGATSGRLWRVPFALVMLWINWVMNLFFL